MLLLVYRVTRTASSRSRVESLPLSFHSLSLSHSHSLSLSLSLTFHSHSRSPFTLALALFVVKRSLEKRGEFHWVVLLSCSPQRSTGNLGQRVVSQPTPSTPSI